MILASIFIGPAGSGDDIELPPLLAENIASLKRHHDLPHRLFSGEDIEAFLGQHFPREVQDAYRTLRPFAYKADLARYCILHELGGIYADLSYHLVRPLPFDSDKPVVFRDLFGSAPWDTNNALFAMPARHKVLEKAIELVCENVARRYYGPTFLCPTGPAVFGKALAMTCAPEDLTSGIMLTMLHKDVRAAVPQIALPQAPRVACAMFVKDIIAIKRKRRNAAVGEGLREIGVAGDSYVAAWKAREVYEG